jgi:hypothetical protein
MQTSPIDPRTDVRLKSPPTHDYRVIFWKGGSAFEFDVADADDVVEVAAWATSEAIAREATYTLWAKVD